MADMAPISSSRVLRVLNRYMADRVPERVIDSMEVSTIVREKPDGAFSAVSTITRPKRNNEAEYYQMDSSVQYAFRYLPGCNGNYSIQGVSQTYEVEWDGIRRPV